MFAALAELERGLISERTKAALAELNRRGGRTAGRLPYGYQYAGESVVVYAEAAKVVRYIFGRKKRGDSLRTIAEKLNGKCIVGPRGGKWHHTSVREVLENGPAYRGGKRGKSEVRWPLVLAA
jgi:DNA invertase Pin-like site-specific DNA recombinase